MNLKSILCPTDFSPSSEAALGYASLMAAESGALLYVVHVHEAGPTYVPGYAGYGFRPDPVDPHEKEARTALDLVIPPNSEVKYEHRFLTGLPEKEILAFARRERVDLIVMGSHGRTGLARVLMGSIAESVVRHAPCPVLTVKQPMPSGVSTITRPESATSA